MGKQWPYNTLSGPQRTIEFVFRSVRCHVGVCRAKIAGNGRSDGWKEPQARSTVDGYCSTFAQEL